MPGGAKIPEPTIIYLTWDTTDLTMTVGGTASTTVSNYISSYMQYLTAEDIDALTSSVATSSVDGTTHTVTFTGVAAGTITIPANTTIQSQQSVVSTNALTITVVAEDESYLNKRGLTHFWDNIDDLKQDKLTAGTNISINNNTISSSQPAATTSSLGVVQVGSGLTVSSGGVLSATGGGVADSVAWGHVTGTLADQTDLQDALDAKADSSSLATVATSGSYNDLSNKPTIGNATLTIQKNGTAVDTFTANATTNKSINITVPTTAADVSALPASTKYGASIAVSINTTDYKVTTTLKDQDGNTLGTAQVIDLPLESVVVNGSYDSTNKKIVLTLQNGSTIDIPVGDLVAGLQSEITSTNKLDSDLVDDTGQTNKFMTSAEKTKLSGIAAGAEVNVQSDWDQTTTTADDYIKNKPTLATVATSGSYNDLSNRPTIPTVNDATLTIQKNGTDVQTFTANQSTNATANITVPTNTSDLNNDSGYLTSANAVTSFNGSTGAVTYTAPVTSVNGDTGAVTVSKLARAGLNVSPSSDIPSAWATSLPEGESWVWYNTASCFTNQPSRYGHLETIRNGGEVYQRWHEQSAGVTYYRAGNSTGWWGESSGSGAFRKIIDNSQTGTITTSMLADTSVTSAKIDYTTMPNVSYNWKSLAGVSLPTSWANAFTVDISAIPTGMKFVAIYSFWWRGPSGIAGGFLAGRTVYNGAYGGYAYSSQPGTEVLNGASGMCLYTKVANVNTFSVQLIASNSTALSDGQAQATAIF